MWWEVPELMIQESQDVKTDADKANANAPKAKAANDEVGFAEEVSS